MVDIKLMQGDCLERMKEIPDGSVDCAVIDPPYKIIAGGCRKVAKNECSGIFNKRLENNKHTDRVEEVKTGKMFKHNDVKFEQWLPELYRVMANKTHTYLMINSRNLAELQNKAEQAGFKFQNLLIWDKGNVTPNRYYMQGYECILMLRKGEAKTINNRGTSNILRVSNIIGNKKHPSEKPVGLLEIMIENSTSVGDTVLDPFLGSGSTGVACINTNRNFIGIELDEGYFKIAQDRINQAVVEINKQDALFKGEPTRKRGVRNERAMHGAQISEDALLRGNLRPGMGAGIRQSRQRGAGADPSEHVPAPHAEGAGEYQASPGGATQTVLGGMVRIHKTPSSWEWGPVWGIKP